MPKKFNPTDLQRRLIKNSGFNFLSLAVTSGASFLISVIIANALPPSSAGIYFYLIWLTTVVALTINLGLPNTLTRFIAEAKSANNEGLLSILLSRSGFLTLVWGFVAGLVLIAAAPILPIQDSARGYLYLVPLAAVSLALQTLFGSAIVGLQKIKTLASSAVSIQPILVVLLWLTAGKGEVGSLFLITAVGYLGTAIFLAADFLKPLLRWPRENWSEVKRRFLAYASVVSAITFIDAIVWQRSEVLFLGAWQGAEAVAFYSLAFGLVATTFKLVPGAFTGILMPVVTETYLKEEKWVLRRRFYRATALLLAILIPEVILGYLLAPVVIPFLYGSSYLPVVDVFRVVLLGGAAGSAASVAAALFYGTERPDFILKFGLLIAAANIALDFYLIGNFGLMGAAWANTIAQSLGAAGGIAYAAWSLRG